MSIKKLEQIEKLLHKRNNDIWLEKEKSFENIEDLIKYCMTHYVDKPNNSTLLGMPQTIKKSTNRTVKQYLGTTRSLQDLYLICKHYFPETRIKDVALILKNMYNRKKIGIGYCTTFRRYMFSFGYNYAGFPHEYEI